MDWQAAGLESIKRWKCFGGEQWVLGHRSISTGTRMELGLYLPPQPRGVLMFLSGLACTWENATTKAGFQRAAAEHGLVIVTPDTSPRGEQVPDDAAYDLGKGAGFYVDATQAPWSTHFHMYDYVANELPDLIARAVGVDRDRFGLTGHSMGGHGALAIALKNPQRFRSLSAFAPIVAPTRVPWGQKAFQAYLGDSQSQLWAAYDSCALMTTHGFPRDILIDQGEADEFLQSQLRPDAFVEACRERRVSVTLRMQPGYDHSYYFVATFIAEHIRWHAERLTAPIL